MLTGAPTCRTGGCSGRHRRGSRLGGRRGPRAASYDEDTTTLGVEAARRALAHRPGAPRRRSSPHRRPAILSTRPAPPRCTPLSASAVTAGAYDFCRAPRSPSAPCSRRSRPRRRAGTWRWCRTSHRTGRRSRGARRRRRRGGVPVRRRGRGGRAHRAATASDEFLDRRRVPGRRTPTSWEERFGEEMYVPWPARPSPTPLKDAGLTESDVDHAIVGGLHSRAVKAGHRRTRGCRRDRGPRPHRRRWATSGRPRPGLALADVLERAGPGRSSWCSSLADGADALVLRTTDALPAAQAARRAAAVPTVAEQVAAGRDDLSYAGVPTWRGQLAARAAPATRSRAPRRPGRAPVRGLEVRLRRQPLHRLRLPPPPAHPGLPLVPGRRPDAARTPGRRRGHRGHLHRRPPGLQPLAPGDRA